MRERTAWQLRLKHGRRLASNPQPYLAETREECEWYARTHGEGLENYVLEQIPDPIEPELRVIVEAAKPATRSIRACAES